jgi:hypothetical protein
MVDGRWQMAELNIGLPVLLNFVCNFCLPSLGSGGYFATEDKEERREIREKQKNLSADFTDYADLKTK